MNLEDFKKNFNGQITNELTLFYEINEELGYENYSQGFGLYEDDKSGISSWSEDPDFLAIVPLLQQTVRFMYVLG